MRRLSRFMRLAKWCGFVACMVVVTAHFFSFHSVLEYVSTRKHYQVLIQEGSIDILTCNAGPATYSRSGWKSIPTNRDSMPWEELLRIPLPHTILVPFPAGVTQRYDSIPIWCMLALIGIPAAWLFHRDRRRAWRFWSGHRSFKALPPSRVRRIAKWSGASLCMFWVLTWIFSTYYFLSTPISPRGAFILTGGQLRFEFDYYSPYYYDKFEIEKRPLVEELDFGWPEIEKEAGHPSVGNSLFVYVPIWLLLLLTAIPTAWLWHRDRRRIRPGCCLRCGYDLTGNTSGVCSECGLTKPPPETA